MKDEADFGVKYVYRVPCPKCNAKCNVTHQQHLFDIQAKQDIEKRYISKIKEEQAQLNIKLKKRKLEELTNEIKKLHEELQEPRQ